MPWYYNPHSGGNKIAAQLHDKLRQQTETFCRGRPALARIHLSLRFKSRFCYVDVREQDEQKPLPLIRLRYFRDNVWSMAFYTWSRERYESCYFSSGKWEGSLEEAIETCEPFLSQTA